MNLKTNKKGGVKMKISVKCNAVRDNSQRVIIENGKIKIINKCGIRTVLTKVFDLSDWEKLENSFGNSNWNKKEYIIKLKTVIVNSDPESDCLKNRIIDAQISAINQAYLQWIEGGRK